MITLSHRHKTKRPLPDAKLYGSLAAGNMRYFGNDGIEIYAVGSLMLTEVKYAEKTTYQELLDLVEKVNQKDEEAKQNMFEGWDKIAEDLDPALKARRQKSKMIKP